MTNTDSEFNMETEEETNSAASGAEPASPIVDLDKSLGRFFKIKNRTAVEMLAEALGTFVLVVFGLASVAQFKLEKANNPNAYSFISVNFAFGFGLQCGVIMVGKVSGGHLNPAVSFAFFLTGRLTPFKLLFYIIGQLIGAFLGALVVFLVYLDGLKAYKGGMYSADLAGIFADYPNKNLSNFGGFMDQTVGTFLLIVMILSLCDSKHLKLADGLAPILVGFTLTAIGLSFGTNCGFAVNPARDFAPRLFSLIAGWPASITFGYDSFWYVPIVAPFFGSLLAVLVYVTMISAHWPH
jgi:MIP family channel proteins